MSVALQQTFINTTRLHELWGALDQFFAKVQGNMKVPCVYLYRYSKAMINVIHNTFSAHRILFPITHDTPLNSFFSFVWCADVVYACEFGWTRINSSCDIYFFGIYRLLLQCTAWVLFVFFFSFFSWCIQFRSQNMLTIQPLHIIIRANLFTLRMQLNWTDSN